MSQEGHTLPDQRPLSSLRVIDLATGPAAAIGRYFAELGADVVRIDSPHNAADKASGPSFGGVSLAFAAANVGKRGLLLDWTDTAQRERFDAIVAQADILIETTVPDSDEAKLLDIAGLCQRNPALVTLSVSNFGAGAFQTWQATDPVLAALNGELSRSGTPGRAPLLLPGELSVQCAVAQAVYAALVAYLHCRQTGLGDQLDLSLLDGSTIALDPGFGIGGSATSGVPASKASRGRPNAAHLYPVLPCKDGFARLCILAKRQWRGLWEWMGSPEQFADPAFDDLRQRYASAELKAAIAAFIATKTRVQVEEESTRFRVPAAAVMSLDEVLDTPHIAARGVFREVALAFGGSIPLPDGMMVIDGLRAGAAPHLPDDDLTPETLLTRWPARSAPASIATFGQAGMPFAGLRVLDLGVIVVGAEQGRLMADFGADVIKVESPAFPDGTRANSVGGMSPGFAAGHRNKRSLAIDLRSDEGRAIFLDLVERSDVVLSNFKPGTMESLGLSGDVLLARNPGLITVESSAFGDTGPWSGRMGYGPLVRASAGLSAQWRYPDDDSSYGDTVTIYPDHVAARVTISAVIGLLIRKAENGKGGRISLSQMEVMLGQMAPAIAQMVLERRNAPLGGTLVQDAPWGVFPCAGDDEWCAVTVRNDADWAALCQVINRNDLACDAALKTAEGRAQAREAIDAALSEWTVQRSPHDAMVQLQTAGVPAGGMLRVAEMPSSPYFMERPMFRAMVQPGEAEPILVDALPVRSKRLSETPLVAAPLMGEHSRSLVAELLGRDAADIERLVKAGVLTDPPAAAA
jgi:crotonobetainyl-CoA:carnitine CoA-transferase CaiB-like acyl-CoA transferase